MTSPAANVNVWLNDVFTELGGESAGLYQLTVNKNNSGGAAHPNREYHQEVSQKLSQFIREKNLLDFD